MLAANAAAGHGEVVIGITLFKIDLQDWLIPEEKQKGRFVGDGGDDKTPIGRGAIQAVSIRQLLLMVNKQ